MISENPFEQFESENNPEGEIKHTAEELQTLELFRNNQEKLLDIATNDDDARLTIDEYMAMPDSFLEKLLADFPELKSYDEEVGLNEYEKYAMWHYLSGSSPRSSATNFDFQDGSSVQEFIAEKVASLDKSE